MDGFDGLDGLSKEQSSSREKTLLTALLLSAPGPLFTGYAVLSSHSTTQLADFIRRGVELAALFISWWVFRQLQRIMVRSYDNTVTMAARHKVDLRMAAQINAISHVAEGMKTRGFYP